MRSRRGSELIGLAESASAIQATFGAPASSSASRGVGRRGTVPPGERFFPRSIVTLTPDAGLGSAGGGMGAVPGGAPAGWAWVPSDTEGYVCARPVDATNWVTAEEPQRQFAYKPKAMDGAPVPIQDVSAIAENYPDMVKMPEVSAGHILSNVAKRMAMEKIHTNIGSILVLVNPFKWMNHLYSIEHVKRYQNAAPGEVTPPHIFQTAGAAYRQLVEYGDEQSIIISGESGAGKTEAMKKCLQYFAEVASAARVAADGDGDSMSRRLLLANPLLEAFGNAKTVRNDNSSRFGKWTSVKFIGHKHTIGGCTVENYLLEKCRVVGQAPQERNFHIFYQLLKSCGPGASGTDAARERANAQRQTRLRIADREVRHFRYLVWDDVACRCADDIEFGDTLDSLEALGFTPDETEQVLRVAAGVLFLGNVEFEPAKVGDGAHCLPSDDLARCADLLGIDAGELRATLVTWTIPGEGGKLINKRLDVDKAGGARDSLAKTIYGKLFDYIVSRINDSLRPAGGAGAKGERRIGVLDIFGFEIFEKNSFEQLCINFCNEMLQQQFNRAVFKKEEALYIAEGIDYSSVSYVDNQSIIDLVERKKSSGEPFGLLPMIDDHGMLDARASDSTYIAALAARHGSTAKKPHASFVGAPASDDRAVLKLNKLRKAAGRRKLNCTCEFGVVHYAGEVVYDVSAFREKNADELFPNLHETMARSSIPLLTSSAMFAAGKGGGKRASQQRQFVKSLHELIGTMEATEQHYVRCIKSNSTKTPLGWEGKPCLQQLRYAGVFEAVEIRQRGFPFRWSFFLFWRRYWMVAPAASVRAIAGTPGFPSAKGKGSALTADTPAFKPFAQAFVAALQVASPECVVDMQLGKTLVMYRAVAHRSLEKLRAAALARAAFKVVRFARGCVSRKRFAKLDALRRAVRTHRLGALAAVDLGLGEMASVHKAMRAALAAAVDGGWFPESTRQHWEWRRADEEGSILGRRVAVAQALDQLIATGCDADDDRYFDEYKALLEESGTLGMDGASTPALEPLLRTARDMFIPAQQRREAQRMLRQGLAAFDMRLLEKALAIVDVVSRRGGGALFDMAEVQRAREAIASVAAELELVTLVRNAMPLAPLVGQPGSIARSTDDPRECDALERALATLKGSRMRLRSRDALDVVRAGQALLWMRQCCLRRDWDEVRQSVGAMRGALDDGALHSDDVARIKDELNLVEAELHSHRVVDDLADALAYSDVAANFGALERQRAELRARLRATMEGEGRGIDGAALESIEMAVERALPSTPPQEMAIDLSGIESALTTAQRVMSAMGVDVPDAGPRLSRLLGACVLVLELHSAMESGGARSLAETAGVPGGSDHDLRALLLDRETVDASRLHELLHGSASAACAALDFVTKGGRLSDATMVVPPPPQVADPVRVEQSIAAAALLSAARVIYKLRRALLASQWDAVGTVIASARSMRLPACAEREIGAAFSEWSYRRATQRKLEDALASSGCLDGPIGQLDVDAVETEALSIAVRGALALDIGGESPVEGDGDDAAEQSASKFAALVMGAQAALRVRLALKDRNLAAVEAALNDIDELHRTGSPVLAHAAAAAEVGRARVEYDHHVVCSALRGALSSAAGAASGPLGKLVLGDAPIATRELSDALALARRSGLSSRSPEMQRLVQSVSMVRDLRLALLSATTDGSVGGQGASGFRSVESVVNRYKQRLHAAGEGESFGSSVSAALPDRAAEGAVADAAALRLAPQAMAELRRTVEELDFRAHIENALEVAVEGGRGRVAPHRRQIASDNGLQPIGVERETIMLEPLRVAIRNALRVEPRGARLDALLQQAHHLIKTRSALKRNDWSALSTALEQAESAMGARSDTVVKEQMGAAAVELRHHEAVRALQVQIALGGVQPTSKTTVLGRLDRHAIETAPLQQAIRNAETLIKREKVASLDLFAAIRNARLSLAVREALKRADWAGVHAAHSAVVDEKQRHAMLSVEDATLKASLVAATSFAARRRTPRRGSPRGAASTPLPPRSARRSPAPAAAAAARSTPAHSGARFGYAGGSLFSHTRRRARPMETRVEPTASAVLTPAPAAAPETRGSVTRAQRETQIVLGVGSSLQQSGMYLQRDEIEARTRADETAPRGDGAFAKSAGEAASPPRVKGAGAHNLEVLVAREIALALGTGRGAVPSSPAAAGSGSELAVPIADALLRDVERAQQEAIFIEAAAAATEALRRSDGPSGSAGLGFRYHGVRNADTAGSLSAGGDGTALALSPRKSGTAPDIAALAAARQSAADAMTRLKSSSAAAPELKAMVPLMECVEQMRAAVLALDWETARALSMNVAELSFVPMDHVGGADAAPPPPPADAAATSRNLRALNDLTSPTRTMRVVAARASSRGTPSRGAPATARAAAAPSPTTPSGSVSMVRSTAVSAGAAQRAQARARGGPIVEMATLPVPNYAALSQIAAATAKEQATLVRRQATHEIAIAELRRAIAPPSIVSGDPEHLVRSGDLSSIDRLEAALRRVMELSAEEASFKSMVAHEVLAMQRPAPTSGGDWGTLGSSAQLTLDDAAAQRGDVDTVAASHGAARGRMAFATQGGYAIGLLRTARLLLAVRQTVATLPLRNAGVPPPRVEADLAMLPASAANRQRCVNDTLERYSVVGAWKELIPFLLTRDLAQIDPTARRELALAQVALRLRAVHGRIAAALCGEGAVDGVPGAVRVAAVKTKHLDEAVAYAEEALAEGGWLASYAERCRRDGDAPPKWGLTKLIIAAARSVRLVRAALKRGDLETVRKLLVQAGDGARPAIATHELKLVRRHVEYVLVTDELKYALATDAPRASEGVSALRTLDGAIRRGVDAASENVEPLRPLLRHATHLRKLRAALSAADDSEAMIADKTSAVSSIEADAWRDVEAVLEEIAASGLPSAAPLTTVPMAGCPPELAHMVSEVGVAQQRLQRHHVIAELRATLAEVEAVLKGGDGSVGYNADASTMVSYTKLRAALSATRALHSVLSADVLPSAGEQQMVTRAVEILAASDTALRLIDTAMAAPSVALATIEASLIRAEQIGLAEAAMCARGREAVVTAKGAIMQLRTALDRVVVSEITDALALCRSLRLGLVRAAEADTALALSALDVEANELTERADALLVLPQAQLVRHQLHAALRTQDEERIIHITIAIKSQFFVRVGHASFALSKFAGVKSPVQFTARLHASNQLAAGSTTTTWSDVRKKLVELREGMLEWSTTPLHTSLCHLHRGVPRSAPARCHVLILQLMGDAPVPHGGGGSPAILLAKLLRIANDEAGVAPKQAVAAAPSRAASKTTEAASALPLQSAALTSAPSADAVGMNDELYAQLVKQLTQCPSVASLERGWAALRICLHYVRPSDRFENYVECFLRTQEPPPSRRAHHASSAGKTPEEASTSTREAMLRLFHRILYIGTQPLPSAHELERALWRYGGMPQH